MAAPAGSSGAKRKPTGGTGFKKVKIEASYDSSSMRELAEDPANLKKKTLAVLRDFCDTLNINKAGKKDELVTKILNHFK